MDMLPTALQAHTYKFASHAPILHMCLLGRPPQPATSNSSLESPIWSIGQFLMVHLLCFKYLLFGKKATEENGGKYVNFLWMVCLVFTARGNGENFDMIIRGLRYYFPSALVRLCSLICPWCGQIAAPNSGPGLHGPPLGLQLSWTSRFSWYR